MPIGTIIAYGANNWYKPSDASKWLLCDGSPIDASKYPKLAALMAYTPNLIGKFPQGSLIAGNEIEAAVPNIFGEAFDIHFGGAYGNTGALKYYVSGYHKSEGGNNSGLQGVLVFNASTISPTYKDGCSTVQPPAITVLYYIRAK